MSLVHNQEAYAEANKVTGISTIGKDVEIEGIVGGSADDVFVQGNYVYLLAGGALVILDISVPGQPTKVASIAVPDPYVQGRRGIYVKGDYAYVTATSEGLRVIDVSTPENPVEVGYIDTYANDVHVQGDYAYLVAYGILRIIDVSVPQTV
jgi:hypothetical protein